MPWRGPGRPALGERLAGERGYRLAGDRRLQVARERLAETTENTLAAISSHVHGVTIDRGSHVAAALSALNTADTSRSAAPAASASRGC